MYLPAKLILDLYDGSRPDVHGSLLAGAEGTVLVQRQPVGRLRQRRKYSCKGNRHERILLFQYLPSIRSYKRYYLQEKKYANPNIWMIAYAAYVHHNRAYY